MGEWASAFNDYYSDSFRGGRRHDFYAILGDKVQLLTLEIDLEVTYDSPESRK